MNIPAEIIHGDTPLLITDTEKLGRHGELDTLEATLLCSFPDWEADAETLGFSRLQPVPGYHAIFTEELNRGSRSDLLCEVSVSCVGLIAAGDDRRRRTLGVSGQQISVGPFEKIILAWVDGEQGEDPNSSGPVELVKRRVPKLDEEGEVEYKLLATPSGTAERWNIRQAVVTVSDTYYLTQEPDMTIVGTAQEPLTPPEVPTDPWDGYEEGPLRGNHPYGWVLDDRQSEEIFPLATGGSDSDEATIGLWSVTDTYGFYLTAVPD
jgi:hypothetical protein